MAEERRLIENGDWSAPTAGAAERNAKAITLAAYAAVWLEHCDVKEHTRLQYPALLEQHINPTLGTVPLAHLTGAAVPAWHASLDPKHPAIKALGVHSEFEPLPVLQPGAPVVEHCVGYPRLHGVWVRARCTPTSATQSKGSESDEYQTRATPLVTCWQAAVGLFAGALGLLPTPSGDQAPVPAPAPTPAAAPVTTTTSTAPASPRPGMPHYSY